MKLGRFAEKDHESAKVRKHERQAAVVRTPAMVCLPISFVISSFRAFVFAQCWEIKGIGYCDTCGLSVNAAFASVGSEAVLFSLFRTPLRLYGKKEALSACLSPCVARGLNCATV
jgi:hypothetical protein